MKFKLALFLCLTVSFGYSQEGDLLLTKIERDGEVMEEYFYRKGQIVKNYSYPNRTLSSYRVAKFYSYNSKGEITGFENKGFTSVFYLAEYDRNKKGQISRMVSYKKGNGILGKLTKRFEVTYGYENEKLDFKVSIEITESGKEIHREEFYSYDKRGNVSLIEKYADGEFKETIELEYDSKNYYKLGIPIIVEDHVCVSCVNNPIKLIITDKDGQEKEVIFAYEYNEHDYPIIRRFEFVEDERIQDVILDFYYKK